MAVLAGCGRLLAVGAGVEAVKKLIPDYYGQVEVACINGPSATVLAGSEETLLKCKALMKQKNVPSTLIQGDIAFHSSMLDPAIPVIRSQLAFLDGAGSRTAHLAQFISTVTGEEEKTMSAEYWCRNLRGTVQFQRAIETVFSDPKTSPDLVIEVSDIMQEPGVQMLYERLPMTSCMLNADCGLLSRLFFRWGLTGRCWFLPKRSWLA